jgi:hypothetical protein
VVHDCEEFIFTHARPYGIADGCNCCFGSGHARLQALDLFRCLDRPDTKNFALAVPDFKPAFFKRERLQMPATIKTDPLRSGRMSPHQIGYLGSKGTCSLMIST